MYFAGLKFQEQDCMHMSIRSGVLPLTWYMYMCLPFGGLFRKIWYSDGGGVIRDEGALINWVYFGQIFVKSTQFGQNWVLFFRKWYTDGWEIGQKNWYRESQIFEVRQAHPHTILLRVPSLDVIALNWTWVGCRLVHSKISREVDQDDIFLFLIGWHDCIFLQFWAYLALEPKFTCFFRHFLSFLSSW